LDEAALVPVKLDGAMARCPVCNAPISTEAFCSYQRNFTYIQDGTVTDSIITVDRLRCASCGSTHALLPEAVVPYSPFSVCLVAHLIIDWLNHDYESIEELAARYRVAINTFYRLKARFVSCVRLAYGMVAHEEEMDGAARILIGKQTAAADGLLCAFFDSVGASFCQAEGP
jgi:hypothetical protein